MIIGQIDYVEATRLLYNADDEAAFQGVRVEGAMLRQNVFVAQEYARKADRLTLMGHGPRTHLMAAFDRPEPGAPSLITWILKGN